MQTSGPLLANLPLKNFRHQCARSNFDFADFHLLAGEQAQGLRFAQKIEVTRIAQRFFTTLPTRPSKVSGRVEVPPEEWKATSGENPSM